MIIKIPGSARLWRRVAVGLVAVGGLTLAACNSSPVNHDQQTATSQLRQFEAAQPVPSYKWSQYRATAIDVENAQAETTQTTSFFFNLGVAAPVDHCASIGMPVPSTAQLTNPSQGVSGDPGAVLPQIEPNGVYTGDTTGTYVVCANAAGGYSLKYWEGNVETVSGPAVWDTTTNSIRDTGPSSIKVHVGKNG